jgi:hypothetical protein
LGKSQLLAQGRWPVVSSDDGRDPLWSVAVKVPALWIGDAAARDVSVLTGSLVILLITLACIGWIPARSPRTLVLVGFTWMVLTIAYELALGRFAFQLY